MKTQLLSDFTVDKAAKMVYIKREFDADLSLVWDAFTKKEILDQWWAPKPWVSKTKVMDFKVGGRRFFTMIGPDGKEGRWLVQKFTSITPKTNFKTFNAFADKDENLELPGSDWDFTFSEQGGTTMVSISIHNDSLERMEKLIETGFREGIMMTLDYLGALLPTFSQG